MTWLLDTNVISDAARTRPNSGVKAWFVERMQSEERFFISAVSLGEILVGIQKLPKGDPARRLLAAWAAKDVLERFTGRILALDEYVAGTWAGMMVSLPRGYNPPILDSIIAATALHHNLTLVTRDVADFRRVPGLKLENPFV